ncbi:Hypothetical predicted protein [Mytilus galloprovincialis]|uniref:Uncharacterized protein n=1 Tax=Mytilus galloprovincialis TaxID=29158 RepID=A0A8B6HJI2_MYTGA|nr:Hypothetical predicted protein [Mytilus galloprovincialis]
MKDKVAPRRYTPMAKEEDIHTTGKDSGILGKIDQEDLPTASPRSGRLARYTGTKTKVPKKIYGRLAKDGSQEDIRRLAKIDKGAPQEDIGRLAKIDKSGSPRSIRPTVKKDKNAPRRYTADWQRKDKVPKKIYGRLAKINKRGSPRNTADGKERQNGSQEDIRHWERNKVAPEEDIHWQVDKRNSLKYTLRRLVKIDKVLPKKIYGDWERNKSAPPGDIRDWQRKDKRLPKDIRPTGKDRQKWLPKKIFVRLAMIDKSGSRRRYTADWQR